MKKLFLSLISFYQAFLSFDRGMLAVFAPGGACKYDIPCSEYSKKMIERYGVNKGTILGLKRIWRCR